MPTMSDAKEPVANQPDDKESDLVWGALGIGRVINRDEQQTYYLIRIGALKGAVSKLGHKTLVGSRSKLLQLPFGKSEVA
jgi:hypothetical protein